MIKLTREQWEAFRLDAHRRYEAAGYDLPSDGFLEDALLARGFELPDLPFRQTSSGVIILIRSHGAQDWQQLGVEDFNIEITPDQHPRRNRVLKVPKPLGITYELASETEQQPERKPKKSSLFHDPKKPKRKDWWNR